MDEFSINTVQLISRWAFIGKRWKTHPEIFPKLQFPGFWHRLISKKLIQFFFQNFNFRGMSWTDFWIVHPSIFCEYLFSFSKISWHELDRFLENSSIFGWNFQKSVCVTPRNSKFIFWLNVLFWMSFLEIVLAHTPDLNKTESILVGWVFQRDGRPVSCPKIIKLTIGWVFQKSVLLIPRIWTKLNRYSSIFFWMNFPEILSVF